MLNAGQQITATLKLSHPIGRGAMGSIWVADHLALNTQVAVKFMSPAFAESATYIERFRREATAAAQIKNPHVVQVFDHGITSAGMPYIVMELLEGEDLGKRVRNAGPLSPRAVAGVISQTASALQRAHQLGIIHRDIKADNIFLLNLDGEAFVKVLDFGIAKLLSDADLGLTTTGSMVGTPLFMSPEQLLSSKHVDARSDLWSLAVVAYFAMTGQFPFNGETLGGLTVAVHSGEFAPPSSILRGLPLAVDAWFQRAFQRAPDARFSSAREMAEAFMQALGTSAASTSDAFILSTLGVTALQKGSSESHISSSPSYVPVGSSPTFGGTSQTGAGLPRRRGPAIMLAAAVALMLGGAATIFLRSLADTAKDSATGSTSAPSLSAATLVPPPPIEAPAPTSSTTASVSASAIPLTPATTSLSASSSAIVAPRPIATGVRLPSPAIVAPPSKTFAAPSATPPKTSAAPSATPPKPNDDIGF